MIPERWRRPVRLAWLVVVALTLGLHIAGIAARVQELQQLCLQPEAVCHADNLAWLATPADAAFLQAAGLSLSGFALLELAKWVIFSSIWMAVGGLIFARRSDEWMALVAAYFLVTFPTGWDSIAATLIRTHPVTALPVQALQYLVSLGLVLFVALFPNGHFVPRWSRWIVLLTAGNAFLPFLPPSWQPAGLLQLVLSLGGIGGLISAQLLRYWRYSSPVERERARWVLFGLCASMGLLMLLVVTTIVSGVHFGPAQGPLDKFAGEIFYQFAIALMPLSIGVAILRNRLFDIDVIIRRTLVYAVLTALLALAYFGLVVVLQNILSAATGQSQSTLVTVLSTLAIAALFVPLRARVQAVIDQRLYRRKYDAARTLAAFGANARDEVDLDDLTDRLLGVVTETMQPASATVWLANTKGKVE